jgi:hypothetical protein
VLVEERGRWNFLLGTFENLLGTVLVNTPRDSIGCKLGSVPSYMTLKYVVRLVKVDFRDLANCPVEEMTWPP